jgi:erythromycin esterase-like protein
LFHDVGFENFMLIFGESPQAAQLLGDPRLERAIGVIYRPETERLSHYFRASLPRQFDAVIHLDTTSPVWPLEARAPLERQKAETYPTGV